MKVKKRRKQVRLFFYTKKLWLLLFIILFIQLNLLETPGSHHKYYGIDEKENTYYNNIIIIPAGAL